TLARSLRSLPADRAPRCRQHVPPRLPLRPRVALRVSALGRGRVRGCPRPLKPPRLDAPPRSGASACPPSPETGVRSRPRLWRGPFARRRRPTLRDALRLVGFAPEAPPHPAPDVRTGFGQIPGPGPAPNSEE